MRRAIWVLLLLGIGVALAMWLAEVGGTVDIKVGDAWIGTSFPIALLILFLGFLVLHSILSAIGALRRWPERMRARRQARRRTEGDAAVTRALIALAAGTAEAARLEVRKARNLLGDTPQTLLLTAEAERLSGREEAAAAAFRSLAEREDARFLGLRHASEAPSSSMSACARASSPFRCATRAATTSAGSRACGSRIALACCSEISTSSAAASTCPTLRPMR